MKPIKLYCTIILILLTTFTTQAQKFTSITKEGAKINYKVISPVERTVEITKGKRVDNLIIPATVEHDGIIYNVVSIKEGAFKPSTSLVHHIRHLVLPEGLLVIGKEAFCFAFKESGECSISIPSSVKYVGEDAFCEAGWIACNRFKIENLPPIVTPYSCDKMGIDEECVSKYYAFHPEKQQEIVYTEDDYRLNEEQKAKRRARTAAIQTAIITGVSNVTNAVVNARTQNRVTHNKSEKVNSSTKSTTNSSNSGSSSSHASVNNASNNSPSKTFRNCSWCGGTGRVLNETGQEGFSLQGEKKGKCQECGAQLYKGKGHKHTDCSHCRGTGKLEN